MMEICPKCGLPKQACVCEEIAKSEQKIKIETVKRAFGKITTLVTGIGEGINIKEIAKTLKEKLACGGTVKNSIIELQGDHRRRIKPLLIELGFPESSIAE
ncbi:translation initiation factor [Candidatus Pacearchaeota archaeon]|nr:translation initiation factor [Candidatus Pacearchaeota archaeon]